MGLSYVKIDRENEVMHERNDEILKILAYDTNYYPPSPQNPIRRWLQPGGLVDLLRAHFPQKRVLATGYDEPTWLLTFPSLMI